jgi:hypothetical protein
LDLMAAKHRFTLNMKTFFRGPAVRLSPLLIATALIAVGIGVVVWNQSRLEVPVGTLTRDPAAILGGHLLTGVLSNLGIVLWSVSATVLLFATRSLNGIESATTLRALWLPGALSIMLAADDLFMLHESLSQPKYGIPELAIVGVYALGTLIYLVKSFPLILTQSNYPLLGLALVAFCASVYIDTWPEDWSEYHFLWEDGFKFAGIIFWTVYHSSFALSVVRGALVGSE